jgi:hypothetical protein
MTAAQDPRTGLDLPPDAPEADVIEQLTPAETDRPVVLPPGPGDLSLEVPEADAAEQATSALPADEFDVPDTPDPDALTEADPADVAEQSVPVRVDDDDETG